MHKIETKNLITRCRKIKIFIISLNLASIVMCYDITQVQLCHQNVKYWYFFCNDFTTINSKLCVNIMNYFGNKFLLLGVLETILYPPNLEVFLK